MTDLIRTVFGTPDAQADAYIWAAVVLAHPMIGTCLAGLAVVLDRGFRLLLKGRSKPSKLGTA